MEEKSWNRNHGREIIEEKSWKRNLVESWKRNHGRGIIWEIMGGIWGDLAGRSG